MEKPVGFIGPLVDDSVINRAILGAMVRQEKLNTKLK
jgi:hypothetical protein